MLNYAKFNTLKQNFQQVKLIFEVFQLHFGNQTFKKNEKFSAKNLNNFLSSCLRFSSNLSTKFLVQVAYITITV